MADNEKFEITLSAEQAALVKEHVANGDYASTDDLIADALTDFGVVPDADWLPPPDILKQLIQQTLDDPRPSVPLKEAFARVRKHIADSSTVRKAKRAG
ncbi:MAG: hypothetical protein ABI414_01010 [Devosia sp.]